MKALLVLEDGFCLQGKSFTGDFETGGEVIFNTGMTGYQEVLTDPSYYGQMVCMTYPLIGNYGITAEDMNPAASHARLLVKDAARASTGAPRNPCRTSSSAGTCPAWKAWTPAP